MPATGLHPPVVVVGSGPSGATAAYVLASRGVPVVVLEAGRRLPGGALVRMFGATVFKLPPRSLAKPAFTSSGDANTRWVAERAPGGLSNRWTGAVPRFAPADFTAGGEVDERFQWPIGYEDLEPYYRLCESLLQVTGPAEGCSAVPAGVISHCVNLPADWRAVAAAATQLGETVVPVPLAAGPRWGWYRHAAAFQSYTALLRPLATQGQIEVRLASEAIRITADGPVPSVVYFDSDQAIEVRLEASAVLLACGAINTARLLLHSTSATSPLGLGNSRGLVGKYLHDHPHYLYALKTDRPLSRLRHIAYLTRTPHGCSKPLLAAQTMLGGRLSNRDRIMALAGTRSRTLGGIVFGTVVPRPENMVTLNGHVAAVPGMSGVDIRLRYTDDELATVRLAKDRMLGVLRAAGLRPSLLWETSTIVPGTSVHYGGTARMHRSAEFGVIDGSNRLHEHERVLVVDASCFTTCVEKNPTLTAMAISARAADRLADELMATGA